MATILAPQKGNYVPRRPRRLETAEEFNRDKDPFNLVNQQKNEDYHPEESEEDYNALFGITEENPQGVGIDEGQLHRIQPLTDASTSSGAVGQIGGREEEQGRPQMVTTPEKASRLKKASILDPNPY